MKRTIGFTASVLAACLATAPSVVQADVVYENNYAGWRSAAGSIETINWDDVTGLGEGAFTTIASNRYAGLYGSPTLAVDHSGLFVGNPNNPGAGFYGEDFYATSGRNVFSPDSSGAPQGTLTVTFDASMTSIGVWFLDVEHDWSGTGITVGGTDHRFSADQGDDSQSFLGLLTDTPFTSVEIHMSTAVSGNGVGIDDLMYGAVPPEEVQNDAIAVIPAPPALLLGVIGLGLVGVVRRRRTAV